MKKRIITIIAAMVLAITALSGCCSKGDKVTPTFMYFVTNEDKDATSEMLGELEKKYSKKINFDIKNVDEDPSTLQNFAFVQGNTPALIMLDTNNDISAIVPACKDKEKLEDAIKNALK